MPQIPDHYAALGLDENASEKDIKKAFRRIARESHPDKNPGDEAAAERFRQAQAAYETLGDAEKRGQYDRMRRDPFAGRDFGGFAGQPGGRYYRAPDGTYVRVDASGTGPQEDFVFDAGEAGGLGDLFGGLFGGGGRRRSPFDDLFGGGASEPEYRQRAPAKGGDLEVPFRVPFATALKGGSQTLTLPDGTTVKLAVPAGVEDGYKLRLKGRGRPGTGGPGDLYAVVEVLPDARLRREGRDLVATETVGLVEAALGTSRLVETPHGDRIRLKVPSGTQPGDRLRVRGQGIRSGDGPDGDFFVELQVEVPRGLTAAQKDALAEWAEAAGLETGRAAETAGE